MCKFALKSVLYIYFSITVFHSFYAKLVIYISLFTPELIYCFDRKQYKRPEIGAQASFLNETANVHCIYINWILARKKTRTTKIIIIIIEENEMFTVQIGWNTKKESKKSRSFD